MVSLDAKPPTRSIADPICEISGRCEPADDATGELSNCMHCGAEMHRIASIGWVRWGHPAALYRGSADAEQ